MKGLLLNQEELNSWVEKLLEGYRVFAPVWNGSFDEFKQIGNVEEIHWSYKNSRMSPKGLFHPHSERMFEFSLAPDDPERNILKEASKDFSPRIVVGIRPCDAYALKLVDLNFNTPQYKDPWWVKRRDITILIGMACVQPRPTCFCKAVGTGPFDTRGLDLIIVPVDGQYVIEPVTEKGEKLLNDFKPSGSEASDDILKKVEQVKKEAENRIESLGDLEPLAKEPISDFFDSPLWNEIQFGCINCGTCTFLCPTCWCFDIQDETYGNKGCRLRLWDSCMFPLFTLHGSGHNPRAQKVQRVRQRFMHKLKYFVDKYHQGVACVGCGRCVEFCPVNIDIRDVIRRMISHEACAV